MLSGRRIWVIAALLAAGIVLVIALKPGRLDAMTGAAGLAAVGVTAIPATRRQIERGLHVLKSARPAIVAAFLAVLSFGVLAGIELSQRPYLQPKSHDERSFTLLTQMLATGRLALPAPFGGAAGDFFESFQVITSPVYASTYFPGAALMHVPGVWAGVPDAWVSLTLAASAVAATYLALRRVIGGDLAAVASLMLLGGVQFRAQSLLTMAQVPALLLGMAALWLAAEYRHRPSGWRAAALGVAGGWLMMTRPQDGVCYLPAAAMIAGWGCPALARKGLLWAALGTLPFLGLQLRQNVLLTGSIWHTGFGQYISANHPAATFVWGTTSGEPATHLAQKVIYNRLFAGEQGALQGRGMLVDLLERRMPEAIRGVLPAAGLAVFLPMGVACFAQRRRWVYLVPLGGFIVLYGVLYTFFLPHYSVAFAGLIVALVAGAGRVAWARVLVVTLCLGATVTSLPGLNSAAGDLEMMTDTLQVVDKVEAELPVKPAVLLIRFTPGDPVHQEPVYNVKHARIEDHAVIRAHDLGERDGELFRALDASGEGGRMVYRFDRRTREVAVLGPVRDLARR